jgi:hypothetical protein
MFLKRLYRLAQLPAFFWGAGCLVVSPRSAHAENETRQCIDEHTDGQLQRSSGKLRAALEHFRACSSEQCPSLIRKECVDLAQQVQSAMPSIVLGASDERGHDLPKASATINGGQAIAEMDGRAVELDPGKYQIEFVLADGRRQTVNLTLGEAEKYRRITAVFASSPAAPPAAMAQSRGAGPLPFVLGGVGLAALGSFAFFAIDGQNKEHDLRACAPRCASDRVSSMRSRYLLADISLGVAVVSLGASAYFFLRHEDDSAQSLSIGARGRF